MKIKGNPETLRPKTQKMFYMWKERVEKEIEEALGITVMVTQIERSSLLQDAYYSQGREELEIVNFKRKKAGEQKISEKDNIVITKAKSGQSPHEFGFAWDFCPVKNGVLDYENKEVIKKCGQIAREISLEGYELVWGGDFNDNGIKDDEFVDNPHIQLKNWKQYK